MQWSFILKSNRKPLKGFGKRIINPYILYPTSQLYFEDLIGIKPIISFIAGNAAMKKTDTVLW
jgi:hypothetical protein